MILTTTLNDKCKTRKVKLNKSKGGETLNLIVDGPSNHVVVGNVVSLTQWCTG